MLYFQNPDGQFPVDLQAISTIYNNIMGLASRSDSISTKRNAPTVNASRVDTTSRTPIEIVDLAHEEEENPISKKQKTDTVNGSKVNEEIPSSVDSLPQEPLTSEMYRKCSYEFKKSIGDMLSKDKRLEFQLDLKADKGMKDLNRNDTLRGSIVSFDKDLGFTMETLGKEFHVETGFMWIPEDLPECLIAIHTTPTHIHYVRARVEYVEPVGKQRKFKVRLTGNENKEGHMLYSVVPSNILPFSKENLSYFKEHTLKFSKTYPLFGLKSIQTYTLSHE